MSLTESGKRTECIKVCFTERELLDLLHLAAREDRKPADMAYVLVRRSMYGMVNSLPPASEAPDKD